VVLDFTKIETQLVEWLPELRPAVDVYWSKEGLPGKDAGPYILFEDLVRLYIDLLLSADETTWRNELLRRAFEFADRALHAGGEIHDLLAISIFEGRTKAWFDTANPFLGPQARLEAREHDWAASNTPKTSDLTDLYGVRTLVDQLLTVGRGAA
jgi:hypothetical protein